MKQRQTNRKQANRTGPAPLKTTFMELIQELSKLTKDDSLVMAAISNIFANYKVVATRTLTPVKLVATTQPAPRRLNRHRSCWV